MAQWSWIRDCIVAGGVFLLAVLALTSVLAGEFRKLSIRGVVVFFLGAAIATGVAQKGTPPDGDGLLMLMPASSLPPDESASDQEDLPPVYTNPVRFVSFDYSPTNLSGSVTWDWDWAPDARYHFVTLYGTCSLSSNCWVEIGRLWISEWGVATNFSFVIDWPTVFSNAVSSGAFPSDATLAAGFVCAFPDLDTDGDGLPDGDEILIYGTRWDLCDSDGDGLDDPDELFDVFSDPKNPDTDEDGMPDGWEWYCGLDPNDPMDVLGDSDLDGLTNLEEAILGSRPDRSDTDGDLLSDYDEVRLYGTNPCLMDTDGDGMDDREEIVGGFDPCFAGDYHGPERPDGYNPDAYCTVGITAETPLTWVRFEGDGPSDLVDPSFYVRSNETVEVTILMGKTYRVLATNAIGCVLSDVVGVLVVTNAPGDLTIVRPVTVSSVPDYNLMLLGAGSSVGSSFRMGVYPDVGGVFDWTNSCCAVVSRGDRFVFGCGGQCSCVGCFALGRLVYEGYAIPCVGGSCGCWYTHDEDDPSTEPDDQPHAAGVAVSFSEDAVIFEDAYTNAPGAVVGRRSTSTTFACTAYGGPRGARLSMSLLGASRLVATAGPQFPSSERYIPPGEMLRFEIEYEGVWPSVRADDIVATATLVEEVTGVGFVASNKLTSVRLQLEAVYDAPENPNPSRHVYGVGEKVRFSFSPARINPQIELTKINSYESYYDQLNGNEYVCPITANSPCICIRYSGAVYDLQLTIIEPANVYCPNAYWDGGNLQLFHVGGAGMSLTNYIHPLTVSFRGVLIAEIPCNDPIPPSGYFATTNYNGNKTHSYIFADGAAMAKRVGENNFWTVDRAARVDEYQNWSEGVLRWKIPIGWFRQRFDGDEQRLITAVERANIHDEGSRDLLIGGRMDLYEQKFLISTLGTSVVEKFGFRASRTILGYESVEKISEGE